MPAWTKWVLAAVSSLIVAASIAGATAITTHGERIAAEEAKSAHITHRVDAQEARLEKRLDRIESKLDRILER